MITAFKGDYAAFSNFYEAPFTADLLLPGRTPYIGTEWRTVEHLFQASKAIEIIDSWHIQDARTPGEAKRMGRKINLRPDWDQVKLDVMLRGVRAKFSQNPGLKNLLVSTGYQQLVEGNTWKDEYWGATEEVWGDGRVVDSVTWRGHNWLGKILEFVREELRTA